MRKTRKILKSGLLVLIFGFVLNMVCSNKALADSNFDKIMNDATWETNLNDNGLLRTTTLLVSDDGINKNTFDTIDFRVLNNDEQYSFSLNTTTLVIKIEMDMVQVNKGYQYLYLCTSLSEIISGCKIYDMDSLNDNFENRVFYCAVPMASVYSDMKKMFIRYDASGENADDWKNKNLKISIGYSTINLTNTNKIYFYEFKDNSYDRLTYSN